MDPLLIKAIGWVVAIFVVAFISGRFFTGTLWGGFIDFVLIMLICTSTLDGVGSAILAAAGLQEWTKLIISVGDGTAIPYAVTSITAIPFFVGHMVGFHYYERRHYEKAGRW